MIEFFMVFFSFIVYPFTAEVSNNYFTIQSKAERVCADHDGVNNAGPEFIVCKDRKVFKF